MIASPAPHIVAGNRSTRHRGGLTSDEAAHRLIEHGRNEIEREPEKSSWVLLARQFNSPVIWLLIGACAISVALGEVADAIAIVSIVVLNGMIGFFQERRAERAILALRSLTAPRARVRRDGRSIVIPAWDIVTGDVLLLEAGDIVPADARLLDAQVLSTNEASLTGESIPVDKSVEPAPANAPLAERSDAVFMGTAIATGTAVAEVVATGMNTELGRIAHLLATAEDTATPLQQRLAGVSRVLLFICLAIAAAVATAGLLRGWSALDVLLSAVSLAVAAVPEGLPAIVTIALVVGVQRMAARHVLIRRLPAVETLGCATVICTDKTGTLTTGVMTVRELWGPDHDRVLFAAAACSDAELHEDTRTGHSGLRSGSASERCGGGRVRYPGTGRNGAIGAAAVRAGNARSTPSGCGPLRRRCREASARGAVDGAAAAQRPHRGRHARSDWNQESILWFDRRGDCWAELVARSRRASHAAVEPFEAARFKSARES